MPSGRVVLDATHLLPLPKNLRATGLRSCGCCSPCRASPCICLLVGARLVYRGAKLNKLRYTAGEGRQGGNIYGDLSRQAGRTFSFVLPSKYRRCTPLIPGKVHILNDNADPEIQSSLLACTLRPCCLQGPQADSSHILFTIATCSHLVSYSRARYRNAT